MTRPKRAKEIARIEQLVDLVLKRKAMRKRRAGYLMSKRRYLLSLRQLSLEPFQNPVISEFRLPPVVVVGC